MINLTKKEAIIQCALGTLSRTELVREAHKSTDTDFLIWAIDHPRMEIRRAALYNELTPIQCLLDRVAREKTKELCEKLVRVLQKRYDEVHEILQST